MRLQKRINSYGAPILFEPQFEWSVRHQRPDGIAVFLINAAPSLPVALELFGRRCKDAGRITAVRKTGPALVEQQSAQTKVEEELSRVSETLSRTPISPRRGY